MHLSADPSPPNGLSVAPSNQTAENREQIMNPVQQSKPQNPSQSSNYPKQRKFLSGTTPVSKQLQQTPPYSDNNSTQAITSGASSAIHQTVLPAVLPSSHQHLYLHSKPHQKQASQSQPRDERVIHHEQSVHSDPPNKTQAEPQTDQQPVVASSSTGITVTASTSQASIDSTKEILVGSSIVAPQRKVVESEPDSGIPINSAQMGTLGSSPHTNSARSDAVPSVSQQLIQRQIPGTLPLQEHNIGAEWQQHAQVQETPTPQEQALQDQSTKQPPFQNQLQKQIQHLQAVQGCLSPKSSSSKLE